MKKNTLWVLVVSALVPASCQKQAEQPVEQEEASAAGAVEEVSTKLVVKLTRSGGAELLDVIEQPGRIPVSGAVVGEYAFEVREGSRVLAVESFSNPFELRALFEGEGEHFHMEEETAVVVVRVPGVAARGRALDVRIHKLTRAAEVDRLDATSFASLQRGGAYAQFARLDPDTMSPQLSRARRLAPRIRTVEQ